jgi:pathogenesis-related protein 1
VARYGVLAKIGFLVVIASRVAAAEPTVAQRFVDAHNADRAKHCAKPLAWSNDIAKVAQAWADTLRAKGCVFQHSNGSYGENLAAGTAGMLDPEAVTKMWYDEGASYNFRSGGFSMTTGHFTQVVWRGTTSIGCGHTTCNGNDIWVCNYDPAGNVEGEYKDNVLAPGCKR